jgi:membrane-bound metal-dependent hydrolase YbcI (DUF457 family)
MPLPLGHAAIGVAANEFLSEGQNADSRLKTLIFIFILSNLPDIDIVFGLLFEGNGSAYHRGLTHGLVFALLMGWVASRAWRLSGVVPKMNFGACFLIILSHVMADQLLTESSVSLFWPFENNISLGHAGWGSVLKAVAFEEMQDAGIIIVASMFIAAVRRLKGRMRDSDQPKQSRQRPVCSGSSAIIR